MKTYLTPLFAFLLLCTGAGAALASTPDGQTPAEETVCNGETGAAYGLCNAYCEAMDCESDNPSASATACSRVRTKFQNITGRDLPCENTCPCNTPAFPTFSGIVAGQVELDQCFTDPIFGSQDGIAVANDGVYLSVSLLNAENSWDCGDPGQTLHLTPAEGLYCAQLLEQAANAQNLTCVAP